MKQIAVINWNTKHNIQTDKPRMATGTRIM